MTTNWLMNKHCFRPFSCLRPLQLRKQTNLYLILGPFFIILISYATLSRPAPAYVCVSFFFFFCLACVRATCYSRREVAVCLLDRIRWCDADAQGVPHFFWYHIIILCLHSSTSSTSTSNFWHVVAVKEKRPPEFWLTLQFITTFFFHVLTLGERTKEQSFFPFFLTSMTLHRHAYCSGWN